MENVVLNIDVWLLPSLSVCFNLYQFGLILRMSKPVYPSSSGMVAQPMMLGLVVLHIRWLKFC